MSEDISLKILEDREKRSEFVLNCLNEYSVCTIKANYPSEDKNNYIAWALVGIFEKVFENLQETFKNEIGQIEKEEEKAKFTVDFFKKKWYTMYSRIFEVKKC